MSRYTDLREQTRSKPDSFGAYQTLCDALYDAADDIQRLWDATGVTVEAWSSGEILGEECCVCNTAHHEDCDPDCPREALRPLFGESDPGPTVR